MFIFYKRFGLDIFFIYFDHGGAFWCSDEICFHVLCFLDHGVQGGKIFVQIIIGVDLYICCCEGGYGFIFVGLVDCLVVFVVLGYITYCIYLYGFC